MIGKINNNRIFTTDVTSYECEVCTSYTSALCSHSKLSLGTALVCRGFITKDTSVCVDSSVLPLAP